MPSFKKKKKKKSIPALGCLLQKICYYVCVPFFWYFLCRWMWKAQMRTNFPCSRKPGTRSASYKQVKCCTYPHAAGIMSGHSVLASLSAFGGGNTGVQLVFVCELFVFYLFDHPVIIFRPVSYFPLYTVPGMHQSHRFAREIAEPALFLSSHGPQIEGLWVFSVIKITVVCQVHVSPASAAVWGWR